MALGTAHVTVTTAATFIPEIWSDEIVAAYKKNLVAANLFKKMSFRGKKGDTVHIPAPVRGTANLKVAETQVTLNANSESEVIVSIDKHYEYSRLIEDIVETQALSSLRQFYTDDAGYALARKVDSTLIQLGRGFNGGGGTAAARGRVGRSDPSALRTPSSCQSLKSRQAPMVVYRRHVASGSRPTFCGAGNACSPPGGRLTTRPQV